MSLYGQYLSDPLTDSKILSFMERQYIRAVQRGDIFRLVVLMHDESYPTTRCLL